MKKAINRILCSLLAVCLICTAAPAVLAANGTDGHWAAKDLRAFEAAGYLSGDYDPDAAMTESQFAAIVSSIKGVAPANAGVGAFADSDESISRQDAFAAIARIIGLEAPATGSAALNIFADAGSVSANARAGVAAMVEAGFVQGNGSRFLNPTGTLTVAEGVTVLARVLEDLQSTVVVADTVYTFSTKSGELADAVQIGNTGVYYTLKSGKAAAGTLYGTADLKYADFYAGDVSSTAGFDAVTSATNSKHSIMESIYSDFRDEVANADGYHILGVENVSVAVEAKTYVEAAVLAAAGKLSGTVYEKAASIVLNADAAAKPSQYKTLQDNGAYSATVFRVADTVTDAKAELMTGSNWGDYQINVTDPEGTTYLRNARSDEGFAVNSKIQGIILETENGLKVGMEYLQSIWVQPYEVSFNVESVNTHNTHIAKWDNLEELSKLMGETVARITYIMPDSVYVYEFPGIYIKPVYDISHLYGPCGGICACRGEGPQKVSGPFLHRRGGDRAWRSGPHLEPGPLSRLDQHLGVAYLFTSGFFHGAVCDRHGHRRSAKRLGGSQKTYACPGRTVHHRFHSDIGPQRFLRSHVFPPPVHKPVSDAG